MNKLNKKMMIGEAINKNPLLGEILIGRGVHCAGCGGMAFETLEQGLKAHGMRDKEINKIIEDANKPRKIMISRGAEKKINEMLGKKYNYLRISKDGKKFKMALEEKKKKNDIKIKESGIKIIYDKKDSGKIKGIMINYFEHAGGFTIR